MPQMPEDVESCYPPPVEKRTADFLFFPLQVGDCLF